MRLLAYILFFIGVEWTLNLVLVYWMYSTIPASRYSPDSP